MCAESRNIQVHFEKNGADEGKRGSIWKKYLVFLELAGFLLGALC